MRHAWPLLAIVLASTACASTSSTWDPLAETPPPVDLPEGEDPRDPYAFYNHGQRILEDRPSEAAAAFYWAARLDPTWASPLYARRLALFMADPRKFDGYLQGDRRVMKSPGIARLDSLYLRALVLNPFPRRREDARAIRALMVHRVREYYRRNSRGRIPDRGELRIAVDTYIRRGDSATRAWIAYSEGRYPAAVSEYRKAVERSPEHAGLRADLARSLFMAGHHDDAITEMGRAVDLLAERDESSLVRVYESKALFQQSIGLIQENLEDVEGARASYAAALQEDLSYHPAHMRLAELALAEADTATALNEMALAAEIRPGDAGVRFRNGRLLSLAGRWVQAEAEFRAAIEIEPLYAAPYRALALALDAQGRRDEAAAQHALFVEKAAPDAPGLAESRAALTAADATGGSP